MGGPGGLFSKSPPWRGVGGGGLVCRSPLPRRSGHDDCHWQSSPRSVRSLVCCTWRSQVPGTRSPQDLARQCQKRAERQASGSERQYRHFPKENDDNQHTPSRGAVRVVRVIKPSGEQVGHAQTHMMSESGKVRGRLGPDASEDESASLRQPGKRGFPDCRNLAARLLWRR